jgi:cyclopropane-fatty-acyl-phospholipid synthase
MKDDAACLLHYCAYRKLIERYANCDMSDTFIRRYFYPDTRFWHDRELFKYQDDLRIDQYWFLSGRNYQRTLEAWRENFMANWDEIRRIRGDGERVYRMFNYYFRFTRALFKGQGGRQSGNGQYLLRPR